MNDMALEISESELDMYTDDSTVCATAKTFDIDEDKLNTDMKNINDWCNADKMAINTGTTKAMLVTTYQRYNKRPVKDLSIRLEIVKSEILQNSQYIIS